MNNLYNGLMKLQHDNPAFYYSDQNYNDKTLIRTFNYRLATWTDFQLPYALDSRGTSFILRDNQKPKLFCRGYQKFFNLGEGIPKDEFIKNNRIVSVFEKVDGSLISVGMIDDNLKLLAKSKSTIHSDHAITAQSIIDNNVELQRFIANKITRGYTPHFELVGKDFRIVLNYKETELIYLGCVNNLTGELVELPPIRGSFKYNSFKMVKDYLYTWKDLLDIQANHPANIEGFVVKVDDGSLVKVKLNSYCHIHHLKDNIYNSKNLVALILDRKLDDLYDIFSDNNEALAHIKNCEKLISNHYNNLIIEINKLASSYIDDYNSNRKEFAIKNHTNTIFHIVMKIIHVRDDILIESMLTDYIKKQCSTKDKADLYLRKMIEL